MSGVNPFGEMAPTYELRPEFRGQPDEKLIEHAKTAVKAGRYAEAGAFVKGVTDAKRSAAVIEVSRDIEGALGSSSDKAYDAMKAFVANALL